MPYRSISPKELFERLQKNETFRFIDVREPLEHRIAHIEGAELLPMSRANEWLDTLDPAEEIVVMCHHGIRSANVCMFLAQNGFEKVYNLTGGIDLWSYEVDESVPTY